MLITSKQVKRACLVEINKIRTNVGVSPLEQLPLGHRKSIYDCPVSNALTDCAGHDAHVTTTPYGIWLNGVSVRIPRSVSRFVRKFDRGLYPELEA